MVSTNAIANHVNHIQDDPFDLQEAATQAQLEFAFWLNKQKEQLRSRQFGDLLKAYGWLRKEANKFLKLANVFSKFTPKDLAKLGLPMLQLLSQDRYAKVREAMLGLTEITQEAVQNLIKKINSKPRQPKQKPVVWRQSGSGSRYWLVPPVHNQDAVGVAFQSMVDTEGLLPQQIAAEGIMLRQAYKEGSLMLVESAEPSAEAETPDVWVEDFNTDTNTEVGEETTEGEWTFEPAPEKDDFTEDDAVVESEPECSTQSPVEVLIETFQIATTWEQIRVALAVREDYKQEAWEALTPVEKKRVRGLMPIEVRKLSEAKKAGLILDFQELREGVYQVRRVGSVLGEVVSASRLDAFLAQLRYDGQSLA